jgi:hypothetical protein
LAPRNTRASHAGLGRAICLESLCHHGELLEDVPLSPSTSLASFCASVSVQARRLPSWRRRNCARNSPDWRPPPLRTTAVESTNSCGGLKTSSQTTRIGTTAHERLCVPVCRHMCRTQVATRASNPSSLWGGKEKGHGGYVTGSVIQERGSLSRMTIGGHSNFDGAVNPFEFGAPLGARHLPGGVRSFSLLPSAYKTELRKPALSWRSNVKRMQYVRLDLSKEKT